MSSSTSKESITRADRKWAWQDQLRMMQEKHDVVNFPRSLRCSDAKASLPTDAFGEYDDCASVRWGGKEFWGVRKVRSEHCGDAQLNWFYLIVGERRLHLLLTRHFLALIAGYLADSLPEMAHQTWDVGPIAAKFGP
ncbi:hypothetical protein AC578_8575 [Pseudocercospora eumusae]|uniref:Uncharacterized protein n=1 Tax=Pseudocercospora eumusae TaxID=321146 RepID=A0A139HW00_9PEZI|nr:hypothetical protein AC578_8575 [Pseudocercospora eumusae]